jgi:hypothetical protein
MRSVLVLGKEFLIKLEMVVCRYELLNIIKIGNIAIREDTAMAILGPKYK